jgi:hypothetical protein
MGGVSMGSVDRADAHPRSRPDPSGIETKKRPPRNLGDRFSLITAG